MLFERKRGRRRIEDGNNFCQAALGSHATAWEPERGIPPAGNFIALPLPKGEIRSSESIGKRCYGRLSFSSVP